MSLCLLNFQGDFGQGFTVNLKIWPGDSPSLNMIAGADGRLPPAPDLIILYERWKDAYGKYLSSYHNYLEIVGLSSTDNGPATFAIKGRAVATNASNIQQAENQKQEDYNACVSWENKLIERFNQWLKSLEFSKVIETLRQYLGQAKDVGHRILIQSNDPHLRKMPWTKWDLLKDFSRTEIGLISPNFEKRDIKINRQINKIRILTILGKDANIQGEIEKLATTNIEIRIVTNLAELDEPLWREYWDIIIFNGHSKTEHGTTGEFVLSDTEKLTISNLRGHFNQAIERGLKLVIFNSCDGLGLAHQLGEGEKLYLSQVIVMRELLPAPVAPIFLGYFFEEFIKGVSLYEAMRLTKDRLLPLEKTQYPGISALPVICQNPVANPLHWFDLVITPNPYQGLSAFQEKDAALFFGRKTFTNQLIKVVETKKLVAVIGASGSGKSSVVLAGLIPSLRQQENWLIASLRPGATPFENLAKALLSPVVQLETGKSEGVAEVNGDEINQLAIDLQEGNRTLSHVVKSIGSSRRFLLVIDQFEEIYTYPNQKSRQFLDCLLDAVQNFSAFRLVITLRVDFLNQAIKYDPFREKLDYWKPEFIGGMERHQLQAVIEEPAKKRNVYLEAGLTEHILNEVGDEQGNLPLLEFALTELWKQQENGLLTRLKYDEIGGVEKALCRHAEGVYDALKEGDKERTKQIFMKLVSPGEGTEYTRQLATRAEVGEENWDLVTHLATARLVVSNRNETTEIETVEIVHEALIKAWPDLRKWIEENDAFLRWKKRLKVAFLEWERNENKEGYLLQGAPLGEAEGYLLQRLEEISKAERVFINLSLEQERVRQQRELEQERKARKAAQRLTLGAMIASVILGGVGIFAFLQAREANAQRLESEKQKTEAQNVTSKLRQLLAEVKEKNHLQLQQKQKESQSLLPKSLLWAQGVKFSPNGKLIAIATSVGFVEIWSQDGSFVTNLDSTSPYSPSFSPDSQMIVATDISIDEDDSITISKVDGTLLKKFKGHRGGITCVSFSPDGKFIASAGKDGMIKFWAIDGTLIETIKAHTEKITDLSFSPDGKIIASASNDNTIKLWKSDGVSIKTIDTIEPNSVSFSPNGKIIASGSTKEKNIKLWSSDGNLLKIFPEVDPKFENNNSRVSFSPDGKMLVSTDFETTVNLWSIDGKFLRDIEGHNPYRVWDANFSPDGKTLATAATDGSVKLWDMDRVLSEKKVGVLPEIFKSDEPIAGFSPDGQIFASVNNDYSINVRNLNGSLISILRGHKKKILNLNFSLDSKFIISTDENRIIKIWNRNGDLVKDFTVESLKAKTFPVQGHKGFNQITRNDRGVMNVRFSPDGKMFASAGSDGNVKLWNQDGSFLRTLGEINGLVAWVSFSPDGTIVVSGNDNGTINLWNTDGTLIKTLDAKSDVKYSVNQVSFSPDGTMFVSAHGDKTIKLWKRDGTLINTFTGHSDFVFSVVFSPDGKTIASASADKTVKLWNLNGTELKTLKGHSAGVLRVSFSPDGKTIASASADKTVKFWNVNGKEIKTIQGYDYPVFDIKFSPDGQRIASVDLDSFRLQKIDGTLLKIIKGHGFNLTSVDFSPDGKLIAVNSENGTVKFLDEQGNLLRFSVLAAESAFKGTVKNVTLSPDIQNIQIIDNLGFMSLWGFDGILRNSLSFGSGFVDKSTFGDIFAENPTFSNDGSMIASATSGSEIAISLWNREGTLLNKLNNPGASIVTMQFSPDGKFLVWSSMDNTIGLWKIDGSFQKTFIVGRSRVHSISFSPDGKTIASGNSDGTVKLWNLDGNLAATLIGYGKPIQYVSFNPDGKTLIAYDGMRVFGGSLDIDAMLVRGCSYLHDYLNNKHDASHIDRHLCDGISQSK